MWQAQSLVRTGVALRDAVVRSPHRGSGARAGTPWGSPVPACAGDARLHAPLIGRSFPIWRPGVDLDIQQGKPTGALAPCPVDRCNVFGTCPTGPGPLRLDAPEARRRRSLRLSTRIGGSHAPHPQLRLAFLKGSPPEAQHADGHAADAQTSRSFGRLLDLPHVCAGR